MLVEIHTINPQSRLIEQVVTCLKEGGVIIYPTDTVYGIGCDLHNHKAVDKLLKILEVKASKLNLSFICNDLSHIADYAKNISTPIFKMMKKGLPGPYTFILEASSKVPKLLHNSKKTVGIRVPNNLIIREIVLKLGNPLISSSVKSNDEFLEYLTDPTLIYEIFKNKVDMVIDGGLGSIIPSTVIDGTSGLPVIIRIGKDDALLL